MLKMFLIGAGTGYVLGARAGREHYDKIVAVAQQAAKHPKIAQARGMIDSSAPEAEDPAPAPAAKVPAAAAKAPAAAAKAPASAAKAAEDPSAQPAAVPSP